MGGVLDDELIFIALAALTALSGLVILLIRQRRVQRRRAGDLGTEGAQRLVDEGRFDEAARLAMKAANWDEAVDLYRRARQPGNAAHAARRGGKLDVAAELYEIAGDREQAAACWEQAGRPERAEALRRPAPKPRDATPSSPPPPPLLSGPSEAPMTPPREEAVESVPSTPRGRKRIDSPLEVDIPLAPAMPTIDDDAAPEEGESASAYSKPPVRRSGGPEREAGSYSFIPSRPAGKRSSRPPEPQKTPAPLPSISPEEIAAVARAAATPLTWPDRAARTLRWHGGKSPSCARGLEEKAADVKLLTDQAAQPATVESLLGFVSDRPCDLGNIEVYYRLGLAYLGLGQWELALGALDAVEEASPGYRDTERRVEAIRRWQEALGRRRDLGGRYHLAGELERRSECVVYRARDGVLDRDVALEVLSGGPSARFEDEARAAAALEHPAIVAIHDHGLVEGRAFLARELVDGAHADEPATIVEALRVARQALDALAHAHEHGVVHGGVTPASLLQCSGGRVRVTGFVTGGAPAFLAPERLAGRDVDPRADVFALGATLYELLTRELPFAGAERGKPPRALREHTPAIPELLDDAVQRALQLDPAARWQSAAAFAEPIVTVLDAVDRSG
jgi:tetratricopeptide (TPR) repeat protein